jgi:hypothetical protein
LYLPLPSVLVGRGIEEIPQRNVMVFCIHGALGSSSPSGRISRLDSLAGRPRNEEGKPIFQRDILNEEKGFYCRLYHHQRTELTRGPEL